MATNSNRIIVGVSQGVVYLAERNERRDFIDQKLVEMIADAGCLPVPVPNVINNCEENQLVDWLEDIRVGALLLSGGGDFGLFPERDRTEKRLLRWAEESGRPVLGVCRGMQNLVTYFGAELTPVGRHVGGRHVIRNLANGSERKVNTFHEFGFLNVGDCWSAISVATDGTIEEIAHRSLPWHGIMWHPEREQRFCADDIAIFKNVLKR